MRKCIVLFLLGFYSIAVYAHPMPSSVVKLSVLDSYIKGEAKMPLPELESALGHPIASVNTALFTSYFINHIQAVSKSGEWHTTIQSITTNDAQDEAVGKYRQVIVQFTLTPANVNDLRTFTFKYDAIIHQVVTHKALIYIEQDWNNGIQNESGARQAGIIGMDIASGKIYPLQVSLEEGSAWKGFKNMLQLGMRHIKEGTDHLLFLIVLLLPAMLLPEKKEWGKFGGITYSVTNLLKIVTAFTIGHSITLLLGAMGWVRLPGQPVEVLIAVSILVSAAHAMHPIFPRREIFVAGGFGLIHGLAFASVIANLDLGVRQLVLSVLGFNLGIEIMQLLVIIMIVPWLMLLSVNPGYKWFRIGASLLAVVAACGWITERLTIEPNIITTIVDKITPYAGWIILLLMAVSITIYLVKMLSRKTALS